MRITTRVLPAGRIYSLSKGDVSRVLGREFAGAVHFGLMTEFRWWGLNKPVFPGPVLLTISRSIRDGHWLAVVYSLAKDEHSLVRRDALVASLEGHGRDWMRRIETRPETAEIGGEKILFCANGEKVRGIEFRSEG